MSLPERGAAADGHEVTLSSEDGITVRALTPDGAETEERRVSEMSCTAR